MAERISAVDGPFVEGARTVEAATGRLKDRIVTGAKDRLESSREYVSENPMKSVLVAVLGRRSS
jgi:ElaB/YqjD/DUF883 family membrane-anchored ribosome-binding protein